MRRVTIHAAKTQLSRVIQAARSGEDVVISRQSFQVGILAGEVGTGPDFLAPLNEAELEAWEGR